MGKHYVTLQIVHYAILNIVLLIIPVKRNK